MLIQQFLANRTPSQPISIGRCVAADAQEEADPTIRCLLSTWELAKDEHTAPSERCAECGSRDQVFAATWQGAHPQRGAGVEDHEEDTGLQMVREANTAQDLLAHRSHQKLAACA